MATAKTKKTAKSRTARKSPTRKKSAVKKKIGNLDLSKYLDDIKIGSLKLDDVLEGTSKNMEAIADVNRAIIDGYTDVAKRQYEMLKELLNELKKVGDERSDVVKQLKRVVEQAKKDVQALQKMASKTNSQAQRIVKKRTDANVKAWKKLVADAKKSVGKKAGSAEPAAKKKAAPKKKAAAKKKSAARKKAAPKKKPVASSLSDLGGRHEASEKSRTVFRIFEAHSGVYVTKIREKIDRFPAAAVELS